MDSETSSPRFDGMNQGKRLTMLTALLLSLAAAIVAGLAWQTWRTARAHRIATERVLNDYASFAAWSFGSQGSREHFLCDQPGIRRR